MENAKQVYQAPELKEWGAVTDITQVAICKIDDCNGSVVYDILGTA